MNTEYDLVGRLYLRLTCAREAGPLIGPGLKISSEVDRNRRPDAVHTCNMSFHLLRGSPGPVWANRFENEYDGYSVYMLGSQAYDDLVQKLETHVNTTGLKEGLHFEVEGSAELDVYNHRKYGLCCELVSIVIDRIINVVELEVARRSRPTKSKSTAAPANQVSKHTIRKVREKDLLQVRERLSLSCILPMDCPDVIEGNYHVFNRKLEDAMTNVADALEYLRSMKFAGE